MRFFLDNIDDFLLAQIIKKINPESIPLLATSNSRLFEEVLVQNGPIVEAQSIEIEVLHSQRKYGIFQGTNTWIYFKKHSFPLSRFPLQVVLHCGFRIHAMDLKFTTGLKDEALRGLCNLLKHSKIFVSFLEIIGESRAFDQKAFNKLLRILHDPPHIILHLPNAEIASVRRVSEITCLFEVDEEVFHEFNGRKLNIIEPNHITFQGIKAKIHSWLSPYQDHSSIYFTCSSQTAKELANFLGRSLQNDDFIEIKWKEKISIFIRQRSESLFEIEISV